MGNCFSPPPVSADLDKSQQIGSHTSIMKIQTRSNEEDSSTDLIDCTINDYYLTSDSPNFKDKTANNPQIDIYGARVQTQDGRTDPYCSKNVKEVVMACKHRYQITPILESHPQLDTSPTTDVWICMLGNRLITAKTYTKGCLSYNAGSCK
eukprot:sb/3473506/